MMKNIFNNKSPVTFGGGLFVRIWGKGQYCQAGIR